MFYIFKMLFAQFDLCKSLDLSTAADTTSNLTKLPEAPIETARTHTKLVAKKPWSNMNVTSYVTNYFFQGVIM